MDYRFARGVEGIGIARLSDRRNQLIAYRRRGGPSVWIDSVSLRNGGRSRRTGRSDECLNSNAGCHGFSANT